jgi:hypothetical protein
MTTDTTTNANNTDADAHLMPEAIKLMATTAIDAIAGHKAGEGSAVQTIAYAIMLDHADRVRNGDKPATFDAMLASTEATNKYLTETLMPWLVGEKPTAKRGDDKAVSRVESKLYTTKQASIRRALVLACNLKVSQVNETYYKHVATSRRANARATLSAFHVPFSMLLGREQYVTGRYKADTYVALDNGTYPFLNGDNVQTLNASVNQIISAAKSRRGDTATTQATRAAARAAQAAANRSTDGAENSTAAREPDLTTLVKLLALQLKADKSTPPADWTKANHASLVEIQGWIADAFYDADPANPANVADALKVAA